MGHYPATFTHTLAVGEKQQQVQSTSPLTIPPAISHDAPFVSPWGNYNITQSIDNQHIHTHHTLKDYEKNIHTNGALPTTLCPCTGYGHPMHHQSTPRSLYPLPFPMMPRLWHHGVSTISHNQLIINTYTPTTP